MHGAKKGLEDDYKLKGEDDGKESGTLIRTGTIRGKTLTGFLWGDGSDCGTIVHSFGLGKIDPIADWGDFRR